MKVRSVIQSTLIQLSDTLSINWRSTDHFKLIQSVHAFLIMACSINLFMLIKLIFAYQSRFALAINSSLSNQFTPTQSYHAHPIFSFYPIILRLLNQFTFLPPLHTHPINSRTFNRFTLTLYIFILLQKLQAVQNKAKLSTHFTLSQPYFDLKINSRLFIQFTLFQSNHAHPDNSRSTNRRTFT